jgi:hypothetical protein
MPEAKDRDRLSRPNQSVATPVECNRNPSAPPSNVLERQKLLPQWQWSRNVAVHSDDTAKFSEIQRPFDAARE